MLLLAQSALRRDDVEDAEPVQNRSGAFVRRNWTELNERFPRNTISRMVESVKLLDRPADPVVVAADLISQAEHGPDSVAVLVTPDAGFADDVEAAVATLLPRLGRAGLIETALANHGLIVTAPSMAP